jgi:hypothetical protein
VSVSSIANVFFFDMFIALFSSFSNRIRSGYSLQNFSLKVFPYTDSYQK